MYGFDWADDYAELDRALERGRREREEQRERDRRAVAAQERTAIDALIKRDPIAGGRQLIEALARDHKITIRWIARDEPARAIPNRSIVWIWPVLDEDTCATALHELAHVVNGTCPGMLPHQRRTGGCVECEVRATSRAQQWFPLTKRQHTYLGRCLRTYRDTPAPRDAVQRLDALASPLAWYRDRQRRVEWEGRLQRQARVQHSLQRDRSQRR